VIEKILFRSCGYYTPSRFFFFPFPPSPVARCVSLQDFFGGGHVLVAPGKKGFAVCLFVFSFFFFFLCLFCWRQSSRGAVWNFFVSPYSVPVFLLPSVSPPTRLNDKMSCFQSNRQVLLHSFPFGSTYVPLPGQTAPPFFSMPFFPWFVIFLKNTDCCADFRSIPSKSFFYFNGLSCLRVGSRFVPVGMVLER